MKVNPKLILDKVKNTVPKGKSQSNKSKAELKQDKEESIIPKATQSSKNKPELILDKVKNIIPKGKSQNNKNKSASDKDRSIKMKSIKNLSIFRSIRMKLFGAFLIPIVLMITVGIISYNMNRRGLTSNYEESAMTGIDTLGRYFDLAFEMIELQAVRISVNTDIVGYYGGENPELSAEAVTMLRDLRTTLSMESTADKYISNILVFSDFGKPCNSENILESHKSIDLLEAFKNSDEGKRVIELDQDRVWIDSHQSLDDLVASEASPYFLSCVKQFRNMRNKLAGYVVIDIKTSFIQHIVDDKSSMGEGSIIGFITADGKELINSEQSEASIKDEDFLLETLAAGIVEEEEATNYKYVTYNNKKYLYLYSHLSYSGAVVCALIPQEVIVAEANRASLITAGFILFSTLIAFIVCFLLAKGIGKTISIINKVLKQTAAGDLTGEIHLKRKDEFGVLSENINSMIRNVKRLIGKTTLVGQSVSESSASVSDNTELIRNVSNNIVEVANNIEQGAARQTHDIAECFEQMQKLAMKISEVGHNTEEIGMVVDNTHDTVDNGMVIIKELSGKVNDTTEITKVIIKDIEALAEESKSITGIVATINAIAEETTLLSLNAYIEAARAGEAGKGFAVVAEHVRKLADQSNEAGKQIDEIIRNIHEKMLETSNAAKKAEDIISYQEEALDKTVDVFKEIRGRVGKLIDNLGIINNSVAVMESAKNDTQDAIESISAMSVETEASTVDLAESTEKQREAVGVLDKAVHELTENSEHLNEAVSVFKI